MPRLGPALAATALLALTACSGTPDDATSTTSIPSIAISAAGSYRDCLEENGIDTSDIPAVPIPSGGVDAPSGAMPPSGAMSGGVVGPDGVVPTGGMGGPGPGPGPGVPGGGLGVLTSKPAGVSDETWTKAQKACASLAPTP